MIDMRRYFFHLRGTGRMIPDEKGAELPDVETAHLAALESIKDILSDPETGADYSTWLIEIVDESGQTVLRVPLQPKLAS